MKVTSQYVGLQSLPYECSVSTREAMNFAAAVYDANPMYLDDERDGGIVAPPLIILAQTWVLSGNFDQYWEAEELPFELLRRQVHYTESIRWRRPLRPGDRVRIQGDLVNLTPHRAGTYMVVRYTAQTSKGEEVYTEYTGSLIRGARLSDDGTTIGELPERPRIPSGAEPQWTKTLHVDPLAAHIFDGCANVHNPIHTSSATAKLVGLKEPILHGAATLAYAVREVLNAEGEADPTRVAGVDCEFSRMVPLDTDITVRLMEKEDRDGETHCLFDVLNHDEKVAVSNGRLTLRAAG